MTNNLNNIYHLRKRHHRAIRAERSHQGVTGPTYHQGRAKESGPIPIVHFLRSEWPLDHFLREIFLFFELNIHI